MTGESRVPFPVGASVTSIVADGVFVAAGTRGTITGRLWQRHALSDVLLLEITWNNDTQTTVPCEHIKVETGVIA